MTGETSTVLVAEDDAHAREALAALLKDEGYSVTCAAEGREASRLLAESNFDAALLDIRMPGRDGLALLREVNDSPRPPAVLIMTAYGNSGVAIEAMKLGAYDYLTKPLHFDELLIQLERAIENRRRAVELESYRRQELSPDAEIIGNSAPMQTVYKLIGQVAPTVSTVLIRGESGTGKEMIARAIHEHSPRKDAPLVCVNCGAIPESLLEAELFGHEPGAFTGAVGRRTGKFEAANGGSVFLDEVGEISPAMQVKLLRVLQERTIERLGSNRTVALDVRILAATHRDLEGAVGTGEFREDLYYRLNVVSIRVPPLRQRREDIAELADFLLGRIAKRLRMPVPVLTDSARHLLLEYDWPGNVRELEHCLERALILSRGAPIAPEHIKTTDTAPAADPLDALPLEEEGMHELVARLERRLIEKALQQAEGNRTQAAKLLKINRRLLYDKLREFDLF